jgi:hypothetical protein
MSRRFYTHVKRSRSSSSAPEPEWNEGIELQELRDCVVELRKEREPLHSQFNSEGIPNMQEKGERRRLAIALYEGNYGESMALLREQNKELVAVLRSQLVNTSPSTQQSLRKEENHINGILLDICRAQNIHKVPVVTAATSLLAECNHTSREYHDVCALFHLGEVLSEKWVRDFLADARKWRPESTIIMLDGVAVIVFDNLTMKVDYSAYSSEGVTGYQLNMTNSLSTGVPKYLAPTMDARKLCAPGPSLAPSRSHALLPHPHPGAPPLIHPHFTPQLWTASSALAFRCGGSRGSFSSTTRSWSPIRGGGGR